MKTNPLYSVRVLKALEKLHKKLPKKTEPLIRGSLVMMARVCGGKNCRCLKGYKHRSLYLSQSRNGKLRMLYIPRAAEEAAKEGVLNYRKVKKILNRLSQIHMARLKRKIFP